MGNSTITTEFEGFYYDGKSPLRRDVSVTITREGLKLLRKDDNTAIWWSFSDIKQVNDIYTEKEARLETGEEIPQILIVKDSSFISCITQIAPDFNKKFKRSYTKTRWIKTLAYSFVGSVIAVWIIYKFLLPSFTELTARVIPVSWEEKLGERYKNIYVAPLTKCEDKEKLEPIEQIMARLTGSIRDSQYTYHITVVKNDSINAFALPGGSIVVFEGLIKATKRPEELAGVLAHEIQHIEQRHSTKIILRETSIGFLVSAVTGTSEGFDIAFKAARTIGGLGYRRQEEESADVEGLKLMVNARIDPYGMIDFFKLIRDKYGKFPKLFEYFSTHPNTNNRIETLDNLIKGYSYKPEKLLSGVNWEEVKNICETTEQG